MYDQNNTGFMSESHLLYLFNSNGQNNALYIPYRSFIKMHMLKQTFIYLSS